MRYLQNIEAPHVVRPIGIAAILFLSALSAGAEGEPAETTTESAPSEVENITTVKLGVGALVLPDFEGAKDHSVFPVPIFEVQNWHRINLSLRGLSYQLYRYENDEESEFKKVAFRIEPTLSVAASRKEDNDFLFFTRGDSKYLRGLGDIDTGLDLGADFFLRTGPVQTRLSLRKEIAGGHDGFTAELGLGTRIPFSERTRLGIEAATMWANDTYMDAFFSIDHEQAYRSIYRRYDANAGLKDVSLSLKLDHDFTDRVSLLAALRYSHLIGDAADSPIVEGPGGSEDQFTALFGLTYKWTF